VAPVIDSGWEAVSFNLLHALLITQSNHLPISLK